MSSHEYAHIYRNLKRNDPEFRRRNAERSRRYRLNLSEEKKARNRETARIRQQRYLQRLKLREQFSGTLNFFELKTEPEEFRDLHAESEVFKEKFNDFIHIAPKEPLEQELIHIAPKEPLEQELIHIVPKEPLEQDSHSEPSAEEVQYDSEQPEDTNENISSI